MSIIPHKRNILGIDESGRGPIAGPVAVGVALVKKPLPKSFKDLQDPKKMSPEKRLYWFREVKKLEEKSVVVTKVGYASSSCIDKHGIVSSIQMTLARVLNRLKLEKHSVYIYLDGGLKAPPSYLYQETIIRGDESIPSIQIASLVAKVWRDKKMSSYSILFPQYGFEKHKGYGTKAHLKALKAYGACPLHRRSFLVKYLSTPQQFCA